jgi:hypothetical protein
MKNIEEFRVVFAFKRMRLKPIRKTTVKLMKACIAIHDYGLPITTELVAALFDGSSKSTGLHTLGDKKCLLLKRGKETKRPFTLEWTIDPIFLEHYR